MLMNDKIADFWGLTELNEMDDKHCRFLYAQAEKAAKGSEEREKNIIALFKAMGISKLNPDQQANLRSKLEIFLDAPEPGTKESIEGCKNYKKEQKQTVDMWKWNSFAEELKPVNEKIKVSDWKWSDSQNCKKEPKKPQPIIERVNLGPKSLLLDPYNRVIKSTYASINVNDKLTNEGLTSLKRRGVQIKYCEGEV